VARTIAGGCLCGRLRWAAQGEPLFAGFCCCADCRKASGSGYIGFIGVAREAVRFEGEERTFRSPALRGEAARNFCPTCGGLVFGGERDNSDSFTLYAGSLDDAADFRPTMAIFLRDKPGWVVLPEGLTLFETMPGA
jgi:hypothetical protein